MKLNELLTESLGPLRKIVGSKFASIVDWQRLFNDELKLGTNCETKKFQIHDSKDLRKIMKDAHEDAVAFVISTKGKPFLFGNTPEKGYDTFTAYYDFSGLVDDEEMEAILQGIHKLDQHREMGHRAGKIFLNNWNELEFAILGEMEERDIAKIFDVTAIMPDMEKYNKKRDRFYSKKADLEKQELDDRPLKQKKRDLRIKHGSKTTAKYTTASREQIIQAMRVARIEYEYRYAMESELKGTEEYSKKEIEKLLSQVGLDHFIDDIWDEIEKMSKSRETISTEEVIKALESFHLSEKNTDKMKKQLKAGADYTPKELYALFRENGLTATGFNVLEFYGLEKEIV